MKRKRQHQNKKAKFIQSSSSEIRRMTKRNLHEEGSNEASEVSKKKLKKLRDKGYNKMFKSPPDELLWDSSVAVSLKDFRKKTGISVRALPDPACSVPSSERMLFNAHAECLRSEVYKGLRKTLILQCQDKYPSLCFERWAISAKEQERCDGSIPRDPLIPAEWKDENYKDPVLTKDLTSVGFSSEKSSEIAENLSRACSKAAIRLSDRLVGLNFFPKKLVLHKETKSEIVLHLASKDISISLPESLYKKLKDLASRHAPSLLNETDLQTPLFDTAVFWMVQRYDSLSGLGFQAALPGAAFACLKRLFNIEMECLASPLNTYFERFCSCFPDTDAPFGSIGSFFKFRPKRGSYEANPPFAPSIVNAVIDHIEDLLSSTEEPLSFAVVIPVWEESDGFKKLCNSIYLTGKTHVPKENHAWRDMRQGGLARRVPVDTGLFFLQNKQGAGKWKCTEVVLQEVRASLLMGCPDEIVRN